MPFAKSGDAVKNQILQWKDGKGEVNPENRDCTQVSFKFYGNLAADVNELVSECRADFNKTDVFSAIVAYGMGEILERNKTIGRKSLECVKGVYLHNPYSKRPEAEREENLGETVVEELADEVSKDFVSKVNTRNFKRQTKSMNQILSSVDSEEELVKLWKESQERLKEDTAKETKTPKGFRARFESEREKGRKKREMMKVWSDEG